MTAKKTKHATKPDNDKADPASEATEGVHKMSDPIETTESAPDGSDDDQPDKDLFDNVPV